MNVSLLRSITSIQRALPIGQKLNSIRRDAIYDSIQNYDVSFSMSSQELPHCCGITELGNFSNATFVEDMQISLLERLIDISNTDLDETTTPISINLPYGIMFTVVVSTERGVVSENGIAIRDAFLGILPFKLIGRGVNPNSDNILETYAILKQDGID